MADKTTEETSVVLSDIEKRIRLKGAAKISDELTKLRNACPSNWFRIGYVNDAWRSFMETVKKHNQKDYETQAISDFVGKLDRLSGEVDRMREEFES